MSGSAQQTGGVAAKKGGSRAAVSAGKKKGGQGELNAALAEAERKSRGRVVAEMNAVVSSNLVVDNVDAWRSSLFAKSPKRVMELCRQVAEKSFVSAWLNLKSAYVLQGLHLAGPGGQKLTAAHEARPKPWVRLAEDLLKEWFITSNCVVNWAVDPGAIPGLDGQDSLPRALVLDTEQVDYEDKGGIPRIKLPQKLFDEIKESIGLSPDELRKRVDEWKKGVVLGSDEELNLGHRFLVRTSAKLGAGLGMPSLYQVIIDLGIMELLRTGDLNGALAMKDVVRQTKKGHQLQYGTIAGQNTYYLKKGDVKVFKEIWKKGVGLFDMITNFDVEVSFPFLDPKFFTEEKYKPAMSRVMQWVGPLARALEAGAGEAGTIAMAAWRAEGLQLRGIIGGLLEEILNHPDYHRGQLAEGERVVVRFNPLSFHANREARETASFLLGNALISPQTATELFGFDDAVEQARLKQAHADGESRYPAFEPKQGLLVAAPDGGEGGKPPGEGAA